MHCDPAGLSQLLLTLFVLLSSPAFAGVTYSKSTELPALRMSFSDLQTPYQQSAFSHERGKWHVGVAREARSRQK